MKRLLLISIFIIFVISGCAGKTNIYQPPQGCLNEDGSQKDSIILDHVKYPNETAFALKLVTTTIASEVSSEYVQEMVNVLENANTMLDDNRYSDIAIYLIDNISSLRSKYSVQLMIVTQYAQNMVNIDIPINVCDKVLLKKHFSEQLVLLKSMI